MQKCVYVWRKGGGGGRAGGKLSHLVEGAGANQCYRYGAYVLERPNVRQDWQQLGSFGVSAGMEAMLTLFGP
jgi:hypothetical protein